MLSLMLALGGLAVGADPTHDRRVAAFVGGLVADAAAMPLHWIYDMAEIQSILVAAVSRSSHSALSSPSTCAVDPDPISTLPCEVLIGPMYGQFRGQRERERGGGVQVVACGAAWCGRALLGTPCVRTSRRVCVALACVVIGVGVQTVSLVQRPTTKSSLSSHALALSQTERARCIRLLHKR